MKTTAMHILDLGITKCYLLGLQDGYLLIDTGYHGDYAIFKKKLAAINVSMQDIGYLLLTHHHDDHAGFAARLKEETGCRLIVQASSASPLAEGESRDTMKPVNLRIRLLFVIFSLFHGGFAYPPVHVDEKDLVIHGDDDTVLTSLGISGKILHTPGHCFDSMSVVLSDRRAFVGDAAMNFLPGTGIRHRPIYVESIDQVYESWHRLKKAGATTIYPAHGKPFDAGKLKIPVSFSPSRHQAFY